MLERHDGGVEEGFVDRDGADGYAQGAGGEVDGSVEGLACRRGHFEFNAVPERVD